MDLNEWKASVQDRLQTSAGFMRLMAPGTLYGFLAASTLMPLATATNQAEALALLTGILGSAGASLIAGQIQTWKERSEVEIALALQGPIEQDDELRGRLDAVMATVETPRIVQDMLSEADRDWFVATLGAELEKLGNLDRYQATLFGTGAIAQGEGSAAAGAGGVAVVGNVAGGISVHNHPLPPDPKKAAADKAEQTYLHNLYRLCNALPLAPLGGDGGVGDQITLEQVYIDLSTTSQATSAELEDLQADRRRPVPQDREERVISAMEAATANTRLVLLGDPGGGKSTFARQVVAWLAKVRLGLAEPPEGWRSDLLPVLANVRDLRPYLEALELDILDAEAQAREQVDAIRNCWRDQLDAEECAAFSERLDDALRSGRLFLVLDGLDEVPHSTRPLVRAAVAALLYRHGNIDRILVTSRTYSYTQDVAFPDFARYTLAPFDEEQAANFVNAWYRAQFDLKNLNKQQADERSADLRAAVRSDDLRQLASNPMLLTTMAIIHQREVGLPKERVKLYARAVQVLLSRWQKHKGLQGVAVSPRLQAVLGDENTLRSIMEKIAYAAHAQRGDGEADLSRGELVVLLEDETVLGDAGLAAEFLDYVDQRAGLLIGRGGGEGRHPQRYAFPHRTFQEYLAGCTLLQGRQIERTYWEKVRQGDYWSLAAQLGAEELYYNNRRPNELLNLMYGLCPAVATSPEEMADYQWRATVWSGAMATLPTRREIEEDDFPGGGSQYLDRVRGRLLGVMRQSNLTPIERAQAGCVLAKLGDPRVEVLDPLQIEWCEVPAGSFQMGEKWFEYDIPYAYRMARYPVTNGQFSAFVEAGGYSDASHWQEAREAGFWSEGRFKGRYHTEARSGPYDYGEPYNLANHPVVGVSWYEALAFSRWLNEQLLADGILPTGWEVRLPNEPEWEKAARGIDGRDFPWAGELTTNHANHNETGINATNAVGCFPAGVSPYGVEEMSGNVWECTLSLWGTALQKPQYGYPYDALDGREDVGASRRIRRVLRGGSFDYNGNHVRCAARFGDLPGFRLGNGGIRVCAAPISPGP